MLHDVVVADDGYKILLQHRQRASQCGTVYDMAVDQTCETVVTVGQVMYMFHTSDTHFKVHGWLTPS